MKKDKLKTYVKLFLILISVVILSSCGLKQKQTIPAMTEDDSLKKPSEDGVVQNDDTVHSDHGVPPEIIQFYSEADFNEFLKAANASEELWENYVDMPLIVNQKPLLQRMNWETAKQYAEAFEKLQLPEKSGWSLEGVVWIVDGNWITFNYVDVQEKLISFNMQAENTDGKALLNKNLKEAASYKEVASESFTRLYRVDKSENARYVSYLSMISERYILIEVFDKDPSDADRILQEIKMSSYSEHN